MTAEQFYQLLTGATEAELRNILCCAWALDPPLIGRAAQLAHHAGECGTCGGHVSHDGTFTPAAVTERPRLLAIEAAS